MTALDTDRLLLRQWLDADAAAIDAINATATRVDVWQLDRGQISRAAPDSRSA